ncbi:sensor histidine kinase [Paenibacillus sp. F411]|uniref:cache domain-containing sensor histidine kinase n=1 Tax=Paenibacillus sp. F411 TaxID=2820239 RepID=UPI001AAF937F|nr:sensor histidine kinase [Paenibacillus sp. F411]MBO2942378.1 sensor histidine kinase [Paenibacillus sp. F411]
MSSVSRYIGKSLYRKILLSYLLIVLCIVFVLVFDFYFRTAEDLRTQAVDHQVRMTQQAASTLNANLTNVKSFAWNYFGDFDFHQFVMGMGTDPEGQSSYRGKISNFVYNHPIVTNVVILQQDGFSLRVGGLVSTTIAQNEMQRLTDAAIEAEGKGLWLPTDMYNPNTAGEPPGYTLSYVQAIRNISLTSPGRVIGVMVFTLSPEALAQWLSESESSVGSRTYLVDKQQGTIVYSREMEERGAVIVPAEEIALQQGQLKGHYFREQDSGGQLIVFENLGQTGWAVVSEIPSRQLTLSIDDFTTRTIWIGAFTLLISMLLAGFISSRTINPLKLLSKGMKSIEKGNYSVVLPVRTEDEVGYLSASFNRMTREINRLISKVYEAEIVKKNAEIKSLQSQINPHFLYNTLGVIDSIASMQGDDRVSFISRSLAKMFRYNISGDDISSLDAEFEQIRLYLAIQKIRFDHRLDYSIYLEPGLEQVPIPKLLFQPLVENSVNHGISRSLEGGIVRLEAISGEEDEVQVKIWNNGLPIDAERQEWLSGLLQDASQEDGGAPRGASSSIGLSNVQSRIQMLYGRQCGITFSSDAEYGTTFTLRIKTCLPDQEG